MDSITHIVLGATIGEALAGRKLGKKAMLVGAIAQSLPDIDFIASSWLDTARDVWFHRGITHSFLFVLILTPILALAARRVFGRGGMVEWCVFFGLQLFVHLFIDAFNAYGTGWFEPFSHYRVSFQVLFVADPFYSCWLGISFLALLILKNNHQARKNWVRFGLIMSSLYLGYCLLNKWRIDARIEQDLSRQSIHYDRYFTTPTPMNSWLWYVVAEDSTGYHTGYRCIFDSPDRPTSFRWIARNDSLLAPLRYHGDVQVLLKFAQGYYAVERWSRGKPVGAADAGRADTVRGDTLVFNVLRFGEMKGWENPRARFVFHYFLEYPGGNRLVVQRGRFAGWDWRTVRAFVRRIRGKDAIPAGTGR